MNTPKQQATETRIVSLKPGMYIIRFNAIPTLGEGAILSVAPTQAGGHLDFFFSEGILNNTLFNQSDIAVVRCSGGESNLLITSMCNSGKAVGTRIDKIAGAAERSAATHLGASAVQPDSPPSLQPPPVAAPPPSQTQATQPPSPAAPSPGVLQSNLELQQGQAPLGSQLPQPQAAIIPQSAVHQPAHQQIATPQGQRSPLQEPYQSTLQPSPAPHSPSPFADAIPPSQQPTNLNVSPLTLLGHLQEAGDVRVQSGAWLGDPQSRLRLEGFAIEWENKPQDVDVAYSCVIGGLGRSPVVLSGGFCGSRQRAASITALTFSLIGPNAEAFQLKAEAVFANCPPQTLRPGVEVRGIAGAEPLVALRVSIGSQ